MNISNILNKNGILSYKSCTEVFEGKDSTIFKIIGNDGAAYALRVLPSESFNQFIREKKVMDIARDHGIPVPKVHSVVRCDDFSAMLMEWAIGRTVLHELQEKPENANIIGFEFGKIQASINEIQSPNFLDNETVNWLSPASSEKEIINKISKLDTKTGSTLLHLDYHPLNVLTDGVKITAIIDWANASTGDFRFDFARTRSILQIEGKKFLDRWVINDFEKGWYEGYEHVAGQNESTQLFYTWAGMRMKRDIAGRPDNPDDFLKIEKWINRWLDTE